MSGVSYIPWSPALGTVASRADPAGHEVVWTLGGWWASLPKQYKTIQYNHGWEKFVTFSRSIFLLPQYLVPTYVIIIMAFECLALLMKSLGEGVYLTQNIDDI